MHILSVYTFQVGDNQQLHGWACWSWMRGLCAGAAVKFHQVKLDSWLTLSVTIISAVKNSSTETWTNLDD